MDRSIIYIVFIFSDLISAIAFDYLDLIFLLINRRNDSHLECCLFSFFLQEDKVSRLRLISVRRKNIVLIRFIRLNELVVPFSCILLAREQVRSQQSCIVHTKVYKHRIPVRIYVRLCHTSIDSKLAIACIAFMISVSCRHIVLRTFFIADLSPCRCYKVFSPDTLPLCILIQRIPDRRIFYISSCIYITGVCMGMLIPAAGELFLVAGIRMGVSLILFLSADQNLFIHITLFFVYMPCGLFRYPRLF
ncbi:hypothetical protein IMSAGC020_02197 [Lachnospiraceae bacterium]|nr:hypothetical protein IMSAGC020_02197 [Lachnospiraceae bacterium]